MIRKIIAAPFQAARGTALDAARAIARLGNADTTLFVGWGMASVGFGLIEIYIGLIAGGVSLAIGSVYTAHGDE